MKENKKIKSYNQNHVKLILFFILTGGLYVFYWIYESWKFLKKEDPLFKSSSPIGKTIGCIIPIINLIFLYDLFASIIELTKSKNIKVSISGGGMIGLLIFFSILIRIHWSFFVLNLVVMIKIQQMINTYNCKTYLQKNKHKN